MSRKHLNEGILFALVLFVLGVICGYAWSNARIPGGCMPTAQQIARMEQ